MHGTIDLAGNPQQSAARDKAWSIPLDDIDVSQVRPFESHLLETFRAQHSDILGDIREKKVLPDAERFDAAINAAKDRFKASA